MITVLVTACCVVAVAAREPEHGLGAADAGASTDPRAETLKAELEERFRVHISTDGGTVRHGNAYALVTGQKSNWTMRTRSPNLEELGDLKEALEVSEPSQLLGRKEDSRGISIYFLLDAGQHQAFADWGLDGDGRPAVFVEPFVEHYVARWQKDPLLAHVSPLKAIFVHELSHNAAYRTGYDNLQPDRWKLIKATGWLSAWNPRSGELEFLIVSAADRKTCYKFSNRLKAFVRCDRSGRPENADGSVAAHLSEAQRVPIAEIGALALVPPATYYCLDPMEVYAEALMAYRLGGSPRAKLKAKSPVLYELVSKEDQKEIDMTYGDGRFHRGEDGRLGGVVTDRR